jgi:hypothetical protein
MVLPRDEKKYKSTSQKQNKQSTNAMHIETETGAYEIHALNLNPFKEQQSHTISIGGI